MDSLTANKVGAVFVFFATSFVGVWVPYFIPVKQNVLKFGLLFASGLFLSIAFLHLAAECVHVFSEYYVGEYPMAYLVIVLGFYMTWFADIIAGAVWSKRSAFKKPEVTDLESTALPGGKVACCKSSDSPLEGVSKCGGSECECSGEAACQCLYKAPPVDKLADEGPSMGAALVAVGTNSDDLDSPNRLTLLDVILLLIALCFHAFFEGLAVGLASEVYLVWNLTISICLNEFFEGMALGVTLRAQDVKRHVLSFLSYAFFASIVAPIGIIVGIVVGENVSELAHEWAEGIGNGLAAGVFICVATRHVIQKAMVPNGPNEAVWVPFLKFFVSGLGLTVNALTTLRTE